MNKNKPFLSFFLSILIFLPFSVKVNAQELFQKLHQEYSLECGSPGGELITAVTSGPKSFNPIVAQETSTTQVTRYIFEGLTRTDPVTLEVLPGLASNWETTDGKEWIFHLRDDVYWNDGVKFTSKDVEFTFNNLVYNPDIPSGSRDIFTIEGKKILVEAVDECTVRFLLPFTFSPFLRSLSQDILPEHKYASSAVSGKFSFTLGLDTKSKDIVGTGPFKLKKYLPGENVILEKNNLYYKKDSCGQQLPYLEKIIFIILPSQDTALLKFMEKEIDYYSLRPQDLSILGPIQESNDFSIYNAGPSFGSNFLVFNQNPGKNGKTNKPFVKPYKLNWFKDKRFRKAISFALNRQKIIDIIMSGLGVVQHSPLSTANVQYYDEHVMKYPYSPQKAKKILASMNFSDKDKDGFLEDKTGNKLEIVFFTVASDMQRIQVAALIKKDLETIGIKVHFLPLDFNNLVNKLTATFDWELILIGLTGGIEPYFGKNVWSYKGNLHFWNTSGKPQADYERQIENIFNLSARTVDESERKKLFSQWQKIASEQLPLIYTVIPYSIYAVSNKFGNLYPTPYGGAFSEIEYIYVKEK